MTVENIPVNVSSRGETKTEQLLSNFASTPFVLDGVEYSCVEAFWQSIKFPEGSRRGQIAQMSGAEAKRAGRQAGEVVEIEYGGRKVRAGASQHHELMRAAVRAKLEQNPHVLDLLLATGDRLITHVLTTPDGELLPDSKTVPGAVFAQILMDLREEFRRTTGD